MKRLTDNISSKYIEAANRLRPSNSRRRVIAYVESYDDIVFWRTVLDEFESPEVTFEIMLPSRTNLGKGKKNVLSNQLGNDQFGKALIACVDADYDFLLQGATNISHEVCNNPFVFHTYVYAIENYQCYARGLHEACVMATLNDRKLMDLEAFMQEFSVIVWPLFVWNVWVYLYNCYSRFTLMDFANIITLSPINPNHPERALEQLRHQVNRKINWMQQHYPQGKQTYKPLRERLLSLGLTPETTYLYIQGHTLFENVVTPLLTPICTLLRKEREAEIRRNAIHTQQRQNELSCYQHRQSSIDQMLRKSTRFLQSEPYQRLHADLQSFVSTLTPNNLRTLPSE